MNAAATFTTQRIARYLRAKAGPFFAGYTEEALIDYILFQWDQETLTYARQEQQVVGVLVGWAQPDHVLRPFWWQRHCPNGRYWYWHVFAADSPAAALTMAEWMFEAHPECLCLPALMVRHGRERRYPPGAALTLFKKGKRYGNQH